MWRPLRSLALYRCKVCSIISPGLLTEAPSIISFFAAAGKKLKQLCQVVKKLVRDGTKTARLEGTRVLKELWREVCRQEE